MNWQILESSDVIKILKKLKPNVKRKYEFWKDMLFEEGPMGVRGWKGFKDESLKGKYTGYRSSRLNIQYRVIYKINKCEIKVYVEKIDSHKYR